jgi:hypothetical protein
MKGVAIIAMCLLVSTGAGYSQQALTKCLKDADRIYKNDWARQCPTGPGVYQHNYPLCKLPRLQAAELNAEMRAAQNDCYQANAAGVFTPDEPVVDMRPKSDPGQVPQESEPRRKFWISPQ